jgi:hypothetical protein
MNRNILAWLVAAVIAAAAPAAARPLGLSQLWASTLGIVLAMLAAYPIMRSKGRVSFASWATTVAIVAIIALTAQMLIV